MSSYTAHGVYIEKIASGPRPIEAVGTSTAGFVGVAPNRQAKQNQAVAVTNWTEFCDIFALPSSRGSVASASTPLAQAVHGFFINGGSRCFVVNVGNENSIVGANITNPRGLRVLEAIDEISIVAAPGYTDPKDYEALLSHCENLKDRVAILDASQDIQDISSLTKVASAAAPRRSSRGADDRDPGVASVAGRAVGKRPRNSDYGALYFPWITTRDPFDTKQVVQVPPAGHLAGIYARSDSKRGVHKAPANMPILGAINATYRVTRAEQALLNRHGVNCIRFSSGGIKVRAARTLASSTSEWKYINVRRVCAMIQQSIARSTKWVVFEPNALPLWKSIRRDVGAFLMLLWHKGALTGRKPQEAFFVKCDKETNPQETVVAGQVIMFIGIAPLKPAEFVIFKIRQSAGGTDIETQP
jgi:phage tail sheath protein FI